MEEGGHVDSGNLPGVSPCTVQGQESISPWTKFQELALKL